MSAINYISKILNIRVEERTAVFLLLGQTVFLGIFLALFDISTTSLFINTFGESMISKAFLVSGILGFTLSAIYYRLQTVWKFSKLIILNLLTIAIITFLLRSSFYISDSDVLIFIAFILMGPLNLLGIIGFWGMAGRLFTLRQGKRLKKNGRLSTFRFFVVPILLQLFSANFEHAHIFNLKILNICSSFCIFGISEFKKYFSALRIAFIAHGIEKQ